MEKKNGRKTEEPEVIGYLMGPMPKRRRRLRDFRNKGADYIRGVFAYGREAGLSTKIGCLAVLAAVVLLIALVLYLVGSGGTPAG